jgi:5-methylcytosine-specific restriction endonuclease McrA
MEWTEARKKSFIISVLRSGTRRWPPKFQTLTEAKTVKKKNKDTNRMAQHYRCAICKDDVPATAIQVDHIKPVVDPKKGFKDWNTFIKRLFCDKDNLQAVCKGCHKIKTKEENGHN